MALSLEGIAFTSSFFVALLTLVVYFNVSSFKVISDPFTLNDFNFVSVDNDCFVIINL